MNEPALIPDIGMLIRESGLSWTRHPGLALSPGSHPGPVLSRADENRPAAQPWHATGFVLHGKLSFDGDKTENRHADFQIPPPFEYAVILI